LFDKEKMHIDLNTLEKWAVENSIRINPTESKAVCFTRAAYSEKVK
jgi:hypothetical protein